MTFSRFPTKWLGSEFKHVSLWTDPWTQASQELRLTHCWVVQVLCCLARSYSRSEVGWDPTREPWSDSKKPSFCDFCESSLFPLMNNKPSNPQISFPSMEYMGAGGGQSVPSRIWHTQSPKTNMSHPCLSQITEILLLESRSSALPKQSNSANINFRYVLKVDGIITACGSTIYNINNLKTT